MVKRIRIGQLEVASIDMFNGTEVFVDWRMADVSRRWRLTLAWGHDPFVLFSERYGYKRGPKRWRVGPLRGAWYAPGVE